MATKHPLRAALVLSGVLITIVVIAVLSILAIGLYGRSSLAPAATLPRTSPILSNLPRTEVCWIETGHAFGSGPLSMTASGLLIRHPKGDVLIDGGNSSHFDDEASRFHFWQRLVMVAIPGRLRPRITLPETLRAVGESPERIRWLVPSHIHLDHVGGYEDLPRIPVLLSAAELRFATDAEAQKTGAVIPQQAQMLLDGRARQLVFAPNPYEIYGKSLDLYGDGSIVIVPMPGHTPGSVGVFINLDANRRFFYVGDAALQSDEIVKRIRKPFFIQDVQPELADEEVQRLNLLHQMLPQLTMIPAHGRMDFSHAFPKGPGDCLSRVSVK